MDLVRSFLHDLLGQRLLLSLESVVAGIGYLIGAFMLGRRRESSPWVPMIALVPFAALASLAVAGAFMLVFFIVTLGGDVSAAYLPSLTIVTVVLGAKFGSWAVAPRDTSFRLVWGISVIVVGAYVFSLALSLSSVS